LYTALLVIGPWLAALAYDLLLYAWRWAWHEMPVVGGRARGRPPPLHGGEPRLVSAAVAAGAAAVVVAPLPAALVPGPAVVGGGEEGEGASAAKRRRQRERPSAEGD
jgi:hypothetical protein